MHITIHNARKEYGLSTEALSKRTGLTVDAMVTIEKEIHPYRSGSGGELTFERHVYESYRAAVADLVAERYVDLGRRVGLLAEKGFLVRMDVAYNPAKAPTYSVEISSSAPWGKTMIAVGRGSNTPAAFESAMSATLPDTDIAKAT